MRDLNHYLDTFTTTDTVGRQLLARAIYAGRHGDADEATADDLGEILRAMPTAWGETIDADRATVLAQVWSWTPREVAARIGPSLTDALGADDPHQVAAERCDAHAAQMSDAWGAWRVLEWVLDADPRDVPWGLDDLREAVDGWGEGDWIDAALESGDPVPPWAIDRICGRLATDDGRDKGYSALAERLHVEPKTVRRWVHGVRRCVGPVAALFRSEWEGMS